MVGDTSRKGWSTDCRPPYASEINQIDPFGVVMPFSILAASATLHLVAAADIEAPMLNMIPTCRADAAAQTVPSDSMQT